ncbi:MAG: hypothetical protein H7125_01430 [Proteobacteria bacterium]|nr:hypothetical protein [Burkholderiales bacterium]
MNDSADTTLIAEIRDLLLEQNRLIAKIKNQNAAHAASAEAFATKQMAQNDTALAEAQSIRRNAGKTAWLVAVVTTILVVAYWMSQS